MLTVSTITPGIKRCGWSGCRFAGRVEPPALAVQGSETSEAAARAQTNEIRQSKKERILDAISTAGAEGLSDQRGEEITGIPGDTYRVRRGELYRENRITRTGGRALTRSGLEAECWKTVGRPALVTDGKES